MPTRTWALYALVLLALAAACGGGDEQSSDISQVDQIRGQTVGIFDFDDTSSLELRYLLQESYGLSAGATAGDVTLVELPGPDLLPQLAEGTVDAVVLLEGRPFAEFDKDEFHTLSRVTSEVRELTGLRVAASTLTTYEDIAQQKQDGLFELNRMLEAAASYAEANRADLIETVSAEQGTDADVANQWWEVRNILFGDTSMQTQEEIVGMWNAALVVGDIQEVPDIAELMLFEADGEAPGIVVPENGDVGDRVNISLGVLDDTSRRVALYAIEHGIVDSSLIDVTVTYLNRSGLTEAVFARQFDVVEASPVAVPLGAERDLNLIILSGGEQNSDGTLLVVQNQ